MEGEWKENKSTYVGTYLKAVEGANELELLDEGVGEPAQGEFPAKVVFQAKLNGDHGLFSMPKALLKEVAKAEGLLAGKKCTFRRMGTGMATTYGEFNWVES